METIYENINDINNKYIIFNKKINKKNFFKILNINDEIQNMNYEEEIIYDKVLI